MLNPRSTKSGQIRQLNIRALAALAVGMIGAGLNVLGAQPFAVGLFASPWDKLAHAGIFALVGSATGVASGTRGWCRVLYCIAGAVGIGMMDELHQAFLPGRTASWTDLGADAFGGLLGAALLRTGRGLMRWRTRHH